MKKSEKILRKNNIPEYLAPFTLEKEVIKNTALLEYIINNDMRHLWWWIRAIAIMLLGLMAKSFLGG